MVVSRSLKSEIQLKLTIVFLIMLVTVATAIKAAIPCKRVGVAVLGMEVPHTHVHLVPLQTEGDLNFKKEKLKLSEEEFKEIANSIFNEYEKL